MAKVKFPYELVLKLLQKRSTLLILACIILIYSMDYFFTSTTSGRTATAIMQTRIAAPIVELVGAKDLSVVLHKNAVHYRPADVDTKLGALKVLMEEKRWMEAWTVADDLRMRNVEDPETRLLCARAFLNAGDRPMADFSMRQARVLLEKTGLTPEWRRDYEDLLLAFPPDRK